MDVNQFVCDTLGYQKVFKELAFNLHNIILHL